MHVMENENIITEQNKTVSQMTKMPKQRQNNVCYGKYDHDKTKHDCFTSNKNCKAKTDGCMLQQI